MNPLHATPEAQELLSRLHDLEVPEPVSWWPPAPGWWLIALVVLTLLAGLALKIRQHHRRNRYRKAGLDLLLQIDHNDPNAAQAVSALLKRIALAAYPQDHARIAPLFGENWIEFLNASCGRPVFNGGAADLLAKNLYKPVPAADLAPLHSQAALWIKLHRRTLPMPPPAITTPELSDV